MSGGCYNNLIIGALRAGSVEWAEHLVRKAICVSLRIQVRVQGLGLIRIWGIRALPVTPNPTK